jgi:hypothetical protein
MQIIGRSDDKLILTDRKSSMLGRLVAIFVTIVTVVAVIFGLVKETHTLGRVVMIVFALIVVVGGLGKIFWQSHTSTVTFDRRTRKLSIAKKDVLVNSEEVYEFDQIANIDIFNAGADSFGYEVRVRLNDGKVVLLSMSKYYMTLSEAEAFKSILDGYLA